MVLRRAGDARRRSVRPIPRESTTIRRVNPLRAAIATFVVLVLFLGADQAGESNSNIEARRRFQDAKFGLFVHWDVYSLLGQGEWVMEKSKIPVGEYEKLPPQLSPTGFNAEEWVKAAKAAGMRCVTITSKHHDGFCMSDSKLTRYDIVDATPYAKGPMKTLADACHKHGLKLFFYYSLLDWHHPDYFPRGRTGAERGANLLLNVGPKSDGTIGPEATERPLAVGPWLVKYGDSVYGTRRGPIAPQPWGVSTRREKPATIYLHVLKPGAPVVLPKALLGYDARPFGATDLLTKSQDKYGSTIEIPEKVRTPIDTVIVLTPGMFDR